MIRPAITLRSSFAMRQLEDLCVCLEERRHNHSWWMPRVVSEARADIETLLKLGVIMDVERKQEDSEQ